ncbi:MAG: polysaccharide deacetylase family protein [Candidatus Omnitrophica bacterium]|nr:polysaccharide deacetylase family protein [Candidatus Omnitrophota bacterium]
MLKTTAIILFPVFGILKFSAVSMLKFLDLAICRIFSKYLPGHSSLSCFLFHGVYPDDQAKRSRAIDPEQFISVADFEKFIRYYLGHGYVFVSPQDVLAGLSPDKQYAMITFDDGYYNNQYVLPILKKYQVPAVFFISTANILDNKSFWWDVLYRESVRKNISQAELHLERKQLKYLKTKEIEKYLMEKFGKASLFPQSDLDRPFTPAELKEFACEPYVHLGNHTHNHAILSNYSIQDARAQIHDAQQILSGLIGKSPDALSYPNGAYSEGLAKITQEEGIKLAMTTTARKNYFPLGCEKTGESVLLSRFLLNGSQEITSQCEIFNSDVSLYLRGKKFFQSLLKIRTFVA